MNKFLLLLVAAGALSVNLFAQQHVIKLYDEGTSQRISQLLHHYTSEGLPGIVVSVRSSDAGYDLASGYSSLEEKKPIKVSDQFMVASVTKMFLGVAAVQLAEKGQIDLDQPIAKLSCGGDLRKIPNAEWITPLHLLNHTSGLPDFVSHPAFFLNVLDKPGTHWTQADLMRFLQKEKAVFHPGTRAAYSNSNYFLLAYILDRVTGTSHVDVIAGSILRPLGLKNSLYTRARAVPPHAAEGYAELYNNKKIINVSHFNTGGSGNGYSGLYSTASDLHVFLEALFSSRSLVADSTLQKMMSFVPDSEENDVFFGLGMWKEFASYGSASYGLGHRGRDLAYTTELWWFPEKQLSVVVLVNCGVVMDSRLTRKYKEFRSALFQTLLNND